jgi:serine/threonine-protein kinase
VPAEGGIRFGQYVLLRRIARGGMAEVFLAQQRGLEGFDRRVAVKRILPHLSDSPDFTKMFLGEAKLAAQLSHPNVVHIYDFGKVEGDYFIAMEFVDGVHAGQLFKYGERERLPPNLVARIGADAASALHYAHDLRGATGKPIGLVHRDVSPANIMISFDGVVKLCDFGIAKAAALSEGLTNPGQVKGKYAYMSPEQTIAAPLDGRSDVFSLAIVLWELLAGKYIVSRGDAIEAMRAIRDGKLESIERAAPHIPGQLAKAISWALQPKREQRASAAELAQALEAFIKSSPELGNSMELGSWVRGRFPREGTGQLPALNPNETLASPGTNASPGTLASPGTVLGESSLQAPITPRPVLARLAESSARGFGSDLDEEGAQTLKRPPPVYARGDQTATMIDSGTSRAVDESTLRDRQDSMVGDATEIVDSRPTVERVGPSGHTISSSGETPTSIHANVLAVMRGGPVPAASPPSPASGRPVPPPSSGPRAAPVAGTGPRERVPASVIADDARRSGTALMSSQRRRRLRVAAAIAGLVGLALISFAIALAASGGSHGKTLDALVVAPPPADAAQIATAPADATPAVAVADATFTPTFPVDAMPTTLFVVKTIPPGGTVRIGDQGGARTAPAEFALVEGTYDVTAELAGYQPEHRKVEVPHGERYETEIAFTHKLGGHGGTEHVDHTPAAGKLTVSTQPYSDVYEAGKSLGETPLADLPLPVGQHVLTFKNPKHATITKTVTITAGKTLKLNFPLP